MKKIIFVIAIVIILFFVLNSIAKNYPHTILSVFFYIKSPPPAVWNQITVDYKYGMHVVQHDNSTITIHYWGKEGEEGVNITLLSKPTAQYLLDRKNNSNDFTRISAKFDYFDGHKVYIEDKIKNSNGMYMRIYYLMDTPVYFGYGGPRDRLAVYQYVLESIKVPKIVQ